MRICVCAVANGFVVPVARNEDGTYTFTQPETPVQAEVKFAEAVDNPFTDVEAKDYFYDPVLWAVQNGITTGTHDTRFSPNAPCTRAETITFIWRAAGCPRPMGTENPFDDVDENEYYYDAVLWAYENGITLGVGERSFGTDRIVTRAESLTLIYRARGEKTGVENPFADVAAGDYCYDAVLWAYKSGVTCGTSENEFNPDGDCLRGQIITFLFRAYA